MSKTIELKSQEELLNTTDKQNSSKLEFIKIDNTPFTIVRENENYFGIIGSHRITESYDNKEKLEKDLTKITWDRITQVVWAIVEKYKDINLKEN